MTTNLKIVLLLAAVALIVSNPCALAHIDITPEQARDLIDTTPDLIVVDVREPYEYCGAAGHIPGALNYPWNSGVLEGRYEELPADGPVLVVCAAGGRSNRAANFLDSKGLATVYDMLGGMSVWQWETAPCKYSGGSGTATDPYQIATAHDLIDLGNEPNDYDKHFILTANIDLDPNLPDRKVFDGAVIAEAVWVERGGLGRRVYLGGTLFNGVFDGNGYTISHLTIRGVGYLGLFGRLDYAASISNLGLEAVEIIGTGDYVGGLVGENYGSVETSYSTGTVTGDYVGGLVGLNVGSLAASHSTCEVHGSPCAGGIVGENGGSITTSYSTGTVTGTYYVGGLVGLNYEGSISQSYSTAVVSGHDRVGGIVGENVGSITTSNVACTVTGDSTVGGLVGLNRGSMRKSYFAGTVSGDQDVGGLVGTNDYNATIADCNSRGAVSGDYYRVGGLAGSSFGLISGCYSSGIVSGTAVGAIDVGGLVGSNGGKIAASCSTGSVSGSSGVGGLVGSNGGKIAASCSTGSISGSSSVGGLVGTNAGAVMDSYTTCTVNGGETVGGLVGYNYGGVVSGRGGGPSPSGIILTCYSAAVVSGDQQIGGLVGTDPGGGVSDDCFWDVEMSDQTTSDGGIGKATAEMQTASTFLEAGWDFIDETENGPNDIWKISEGLDYPRLWWEKYGGGTGEPNDPYLIYTAEHLNAVGAEPNDWDKHFKLMANVDLSGYSYDTALIAPDIDPCNPGFQGASFTGVFDGNDHTISNLTIHGGGYLGLFGRSDAEAEVSNLGVVDPNITGSDYVGTLMGFNRARIASCYCTGTVSGDKRVGGLTGRNWRTITASYNAAAVTGNDDVGGLAGGNYGNITMSYNTGAITAERDVGGLVGENYGSIAMSYSNGAVVGDWRAGGLVGYNWSDTGTVSGFWDVETSGLLTSDGGIGKTSAEMQTAGTYLEAGWDFVDETANGTEDIWWILEGRDYPRLWWETGN